MTQMGYRIRRHLISVLLFALSGMVLCYMPVFAQSMSAIKAENPADGSEESRAQSRLEIPYGGNKLVLLSDRQAIVGESIYRATGNVLITFLDMVISCDEAEYDKETLRLSTRGKTSFRQPKISLTGSALELDTDSKTVTIRDASGYLYDTLGRSDREFFLTGGMVKRIESDMFQIHWGTEKKN